MPINNERGSVVIITAVLILALLTIIGISSMKTSITELQISTNHMISQMNFYAAESGAPHGSLWLKTLDLKDDTDTASFGPLDASDEPEWFELSNKTRYTWKVQHRVNTDGDILYYGDTDGNFSWEVNTTTGVPLETIDADGTHLRGGIARVRTTWIYQPAFPLPQSALYATELVEKNGGSGAIWGEDQSGSGCSGVADIAVDGAPFTSIDGKTVDTVDVKDIVLDGGDGDSITYGSAAYPVPVIRDVLLKMATLELTGIVPDTDGFEGVLFVHPDIDGNIDSQKLNGKGILFVDGDLEVNGGIGWEGMIIVNGDILVNGGGGLTVDGAVAAWGNVLLNGSVSIKYDCEKIADMFDKYSKYRMTSWRQM